jgi:hypothetical protein
VIYHIWMVQGSPGFAVTTAKQDRGAVVVPAPADPIGPHGTIYHVLDDTVCFAAGHEGLLHSDAVVIGSLVVYLDPVFKRLAAKTFPDIAVVSLPIHDGTATDITAPGIIAHQETVAAAAFDQISEIARDQHVKIYKQGSPRELVFGPVYLHFLPAPPTVLVLADDIDQWQGLAKF